MGNELAIKRLLIANRGEIAVRIIRAARELGIYTIAAHSSADKTSLAVMLADEAIEIGAAQAVKSYLNKQAILKAAIDTKADAVATGYGFLAENAEFAQMVVDAGIIFVGPDAKTIEQMGDKAIARKTAKNANVPVVTGSEGILQNLEDAEIAAAQVGFPLMIKAAAGGGGKGIRLVETKEDFASAFTSAQREALGAFGDAGMYLERFIQSARHIEVQIIGDGKNVIHLFERECSLQRRRQKVFEEAPSPVLNDETRANLCESAVKLAKSVNYRGAGTLEYLYDEKSKEFFFIEMNTRIQVEHPITEMITGIDIVREMLQVAGGLPLSLKQEEIKINGAAIECRINAENPLNNFAPNIGTIEKIQWPAGFGVRIDSMLYAGYSVPPFYDSMLAKIIVWDKTRKQALNRMRGALKETKISPLTTTLSLHTALLEQPDIQTANYHTSWLEQWHESWQKNQNQEQT